MSSSEESKSRSDKEKKKSKHQKKHEQSSKKRNDDELDERTLAYEEKEQRIHILEIPDTYLGTAKKIKKDDWVYDKETDSIIKKEIRTPAAMKGLFKEPLNNCTDNVLRTRSLKNSKYECTEIVVNAKGKRFKFWNDGKPIPASRNDKGKYIAEMIFGTLLSGSSYNEAREGGGRNGYGIKLDNVWSKKFKVTHLDPETKRMVKIQWIDNMSKLESIEIDENVKGDSYVEVDIDLDIERLSYEEFDEDAISLFEKYVIDAAGTSQVPIKFNKKVYNIPSFKDYAKYYHKTEKTWSFKIKGDGVKMNIVVVDTPENGKHIAFTNCVYNMNGGRHVESASKMISDSILNYVKSTFKESDLKGIRLSKKDILPNVSIFVDCKMLNPEFDSQSKYSLDTEMPKLKFTDEKEPTFKGWDLIKQIQKAIDWKKYQKLTKTDAKRTDGGDIKRGVDANNAGKKPEDCILMCVEGNSASGYAETAIQYINGGRDNVGIKFFKGKILNTYDKSLLKIAKNPEIKEFKKMMGLREGEDYTTEKGKKTLRYHKILIMTDADHDGTHIKGLLIVYIMVFFPSLIKEGIVEYLRTPYAIYDNTVKIYSELELKNFINNSKNFNKNKLRYLKGLGGSDEEDVRTDFIKPKIIQLCFDKKGPDSISFAFDKKKADDRKRFMAKFSVKEINPKLKKQTITEFIKEELPEFFLYSLLRAIPKIGDGLKDSERRIVYLGLQQPQGHLIKTAQLASKVAEKTHYHHGEKNLGITATSIAAEYVGSPNYNILKGKGQFGSRDMGGKNAGDPRYTSVYLPPHVKNFFPKEFEICWEMEETDGEQTLPKVLYSVVPLWAVNGVRGIAVGFASYMPPGKLEDIIDWYYNRIAGKPTVEPTPWFHGFKGKVKIIDKTVKADHSVEKVAKKNKKLQTKSKDSSDSKSDSSSSSETESDKDDDSKEEVIVKKTQGLKVFDFFEVDPSVQKSYPRRTLQTFGVIEKKDKNTIILRELPVERWTDNYRLWLQEQKKEGNIKSFKTRSIKDNINFEIKGSIFRKRKTLKLVSNFGLNNMILLDDHFHPRHFPSVQIALEYWYEYMLKIYKIRKELQLKEIQNKIDIVTHTYRFVKLIVEKKLDPSKYNDEEEDEFVEICRKGKVDVKLKRDPPTSSHTRKGLEKLANERDSRQFEYDTLENTKIETLWKNDLDRFCKSWETFKKKETSNKKKITKDSKKAQEENEKSLEKED